MEDKKNTAVFFSYPSRDTIDQFKIKKLEEYAFAIDKVKIVWNSDDFSFLDKQAKIKQITEKEIEQILIIGENPGFLKSFFSEILANAGKDPSQIIFLDFQDYFDNEQSFDIYSKELLRRVIDPVGNKDSRIKGFKVESLPETLVVGAGIAGIQASLEIANSKHKVYLVEKSGTIGGYMAKFDKTFPTLDCAACILTPKMVEVGQHSFIELLTNCDIVSIDGRPGKFKVKILKKARRVNLSTCIGCGICSEKCPSKTINEFDEGMSMRKAIYIPFPQAVPNKYLIDPENCTYVQSGKCGVCAKVCPANAIDLDEKDEYLEIMVGNIIMATGFKPFDAKKIERYGYGKYPNVLTSLELERLINASGPTGGDITYRSQDKKGNWIFQKGQGEPQKFALVHCVGSRDIQHRTYCSRVCCMYSLKLAHLIKEKIPEAEVSEYFIDMRAYGKGYEEFYERIKAEGIYMVRGRTATVKQKNDKLILRSEDILNDRLIESEVDMVILSVGLEPADDAAKLASLAGIQLSNDGWFKELKSASDSECTNVSGILIAGACQGPKDIPDSVAQGSAAAAIVLENLLTGNIDQYKEAPVNEYASEATKNI
ncbi:MAG: CoB--CoM heterodisulfide reductase iron-sulfur subunit A family protein [Bacteroidetes bacterium]|nr:CoB--CoM heterodisulfide reductase iron-sulfur subunit A family protein [Bacteroidota bacterium]